MTYLYLGGLVTAAAGLIVLFVRTEASATADNRHPTAPASGA
jgi:hypothetical protein